VEAVKRNRDRFPGDFMFQLAAEEGDGFRSQSATSSSWGGRRYPPYAFTEHRAITALVGAPPLDDSGTYVTIGCRR
jgi:hypothetical protein